MDTILRKVGVLFCSKWSTGGSQEKVDFPHSYRFIFLQATKEFDIITKTRRQDPGGTDYSTKRHHSPTPSEIAQRYRFNTRYRQQAETIATFVSELRSIAEFCNYGESLNDMLRDRLVCGINDSAIQRRLLAENKLSFTKAMEISQGMEAATKNAQTLQSSRGVGEVQPGAVHKLYSQQKKSTPETTCYRCGKGGHLPVKCRYNDSKCHSCGK